MNDMSEEWLRQAIVHSLDIDELLELLGIEDVDDILNIIPWGVVLNNEEDIKKAIGYGDSIYEDGIQES